jgi:arylsulfatase A-like enzyme
MKLRPQKPNILIIVVDSMRKDHVSCYGYPRLTTPNIDQLAAKGCIFEKAITAAPFSPASYASLFSDLYPYQHGVNGDTVRVWPDHFPRLAEYMKSQGYFTFGISNNDFVSRKTNATRGFDYYEDVWNPDFFLRAHQKAIRGVNKYIGYGWSRYLHTNRLQCSAKGDSLRSAKLAASIIQHNNEQPFFGFLVLMDPHAPYNRNRRQFVSRNKTANRFLRDFNDGKMWTNCMANHADPPEEYLQFALDFYDSEIHYADAGIGYIYKQLQALNLLEDTIVVVTADHGEGFGEQGVYGHGFSLCDALTRVPLIIHGPRYWRPGSRYTGLVQLHDVHQLCCSVANDGTPHAELYPYCLTQAADNRWPGREAAFSEFPLQTGTLKMFHNINPDFKTEHWDKPMWSVRTAHWRYIEYEGGDCELFDLIRNPKEKISVETSYPAVVEEMKSLLAVHKRGYTPQSEYVSAKSNEQDLDAVALERLRALGYIE